MAVEALVSCAWLKEQLDAGREDIRVIDGTWHLPPWKRDAEKEYLERHIQGAVRFDIMKVQDKQAKVFNMLPPASQFEEQVGQMGISNETHVVIYDNNANFGIFSAGRVWWMFKTFGHEKVSILNGGMPKWLSDGLPTVSGAQMAVAACPYKATYHPELVRSYEQVMTIYETQNEQYVDARPKGRFDGTAPEPNPKNYSGHMKGSFNLPFMNMMDPATKTVKDTAAIRREFEKAGIDLSKPVVVGCAGAVVAPFVTFAGHLIGKQIPVYDGSWIEWLRTAPDETKNLGIKGEDLKK